MVGRAPAERLDPDSISTGAPPGFGTESSQELSATKTTPEDLEVETT
jgi:hypothetical protein